MLKVKVKIRADLKLMRERFAIIVSKYGIELNATSRSVRGESEKLRILRVTTMKKRQADFKHQAYQSTDKDPKRRKMKSIKRLKPKEHIRKRKVKDSTSAVQIRRLFLHYIIC